MRSVFASFLLLLQLQPVLGASFCLGLIPVPTRAECEMPEHGSAPSQDHSRSVPSPSPNCVIASICAPAPLAVPGFSYLLQTSPLPSSLASISRTEQPLDFYTAPPFHPPKA